MYQFLSKKRVIATVLGLGLGLAGSVLAAPPLQARSASLQCAERRVVVQAACFPYVGPIMACTRQSIHFFSVDGKALGTRLFQPWPIEKGDDYPVIEERFGELSCVKTKKNKEVVVASMSNGGNCDECEWFDVYGPDGVLLGSTRDRKKHNAVVDAAVAALYDKKEKNVLSHQSFTDFYKDYGAK